VGPAEWGICTRTVLCPQYPLALAYWNNTIAAGSTDGDGDITTFDALTGTQTAIISGHTDFIRSLTYSFDGTLLVSGSEDESIKLWDVQTGGVIKTFCGHTNLVRSVSISADNTTIASGSVDKTIRVWSIETGNCFVGMLKHWVTTVSFSPTNSQLLLSVCDDGTVQQWNIDGHQIGSPIPGSHVAFSPDGTQFVSCNGSIVTVRNTDSGTTVVEFNLAIDVEYCYFSPDQRSIAVAAGRTIYLWDITSPDPCLIQTPIGHADEITSLVFSSSSTLISASLDGSIKFWQIGTFSTDPVAPDLESMPLTFAPIRSVSLQAKDGLAFSVDSEGVVRTWDILTGLCKESVTIPAKGIDLADTQVISGRLVVVWVDYGSRVIQAWDAERGELHTVGTAYKLPNSLRILGDGSRVVGVGTEYIQVWSIWVEKPANSAFLINDSILDPPCINSSKVLLYSEFSTQVWDLGDPGSTPIRLSETSLDRPHLNLIDARRWWHTSLVRIEDSVTKKDVFQLCGRYANPQSIQWNGQYLIAGYSSGEVLILDFSQMLA